MRTIPPAVDGERITTSVRFRRSLRKAVDELAVLLGGLSREETIHLLLVDGVMSAYRRLDIERDPAATAAYLLGVVGGTWAGDLSDDERDAFGIAGAALERIAQIRARETGTGEDDR